MVVHVCNRADQEAEAELSERERLSDLKMSLFQLRLVKECRPSLHSLLTITAFPSAWE